MIVDSTKVKLLWNISRHYFRHCRLLLPSRLIMDEQNKFIIIGISGTTNSGKTSLVAKLNKRYPDAHTMCLDHYFLEPDDKRLEPYIVPEVDHVNWEREYQSCTVKCDDKRLEPYIVPEVDHVNWEQFGALDMDRLLKDVEKWKADCLSSGFPTVPILIIEGFLIFNHSVLTTYFHKKYFLTIDKETCIERRRHRCYNPPDKPGYFEVVVWPMYLKNRQEMEAQTDIVYFDGTKDQDEIVQRMSDDIEQLRKAHTV